MTPEVARIARRADLTGWKTVEYGDQTVPVRVPESGRALELGEVPPLTHPREAIHRSIHSPIGCHPLPTILREKGKPAGDLCVCITTSDINRAFIAADVRFATALVESHFMAGASGGRKAVGPALVSQQTIEKVHIAQDRWAGKTSSRALFSG